MAAPGSCQRPCSFAYPSTVGDVVGPPSGQAQVTECRVVDREHRRGGAELRAHVRDRGAVGERDPRDRGAGELHELPDHSVRTQGFRDREHQVGRGDAGAELAGQLDPDDRRDEHAQRLPEQRDLGLDPADTPGQHAQRVDHRGVGVGAGAGVRERPAVTALDHAREVLEVDLVHDPGAGRHDVHTVEPLAPLEEAEAFRVARVLDLHVAAQRVRAAGHLGRDGVVDGQVAGDVRAHRGRVAARLGDGVAQRGQVRQHRDAVGVVQEDPGRREGDDTPVSAVSGARASRSARPSPCGRLRGAAGFPAGSCGSAAAARRRARRPGGAPGTRCRPARAGRGWRSCPPCLSWSRDPFRIAYRL